MPRFYDMIPSETKCKNCPYFTIWSGPYGLVDYPACGHPDSGPRVINLLDEIENCPKSSACG